MKKTFVAILMVMLIMNCSAVLSQDNNPVREIQFGTGYSHLRFLDKQVSPLLYSSHSPVLDFSFHKRNRNRIFNFELSLSPGVNRPVEYPERQFKYEFAENYGELESFNLEVKNNFQFQNSIKLNYLFKLKQLSNDRLSIYTGGQFKQYFFMSMTFAPIFLMSELSLGPKVYIDYRVNESISLSSSLSVPVVSLVTRLPYSLDPANGKNNSFVAAYRRGSDLTSLNSYQRIDIKLAVRKQFNTKWAASIEYSFDWYHYSERTGIKAYDNSFHIKLTRYLKTK